MRASRILTGVTFWLAVLFSAAPALGQAAPAAPIGPCGGPERRALDFWIGDWELSWGDGQRANSQVAPILKGCALEERFAAEGGLELVGRSFTAYDTARRRWRQTWVDDQGGVLTFDGALHGRDLVLYEVRFAADAPYRRIRFEDVTPEAFTWRWQRSPDGRAWEDVWVIHYARKPKEGGG